MRFNECIHETRMMEMLFPKISKDSFRHENNYFRRSVMQTDTTVFSNAYKKKI